MRALVVGLVIVISTSAWAQPGLTPPAGPSYGTPLPPPAPLYTEQNYRWEMAVADLAAVALFSSGNKAGIGAGFTAYALGGPIVHAANGLGGRAAASLGVRVGLPLVLGLGLAALASHNDHCAADDWDCGGDAGLAAAFGVGLGMITAVLIDDLVIAKPHRVYNHDVRLTANVDHGRASLGLAGRF